MENFRLDKIKKLDSNQDEMVHPVSDFATDIPAYKPIRVINLLNQML
jgi:hypothetical protein